MGKLDQFIKQVFADETKSATKHCLAFEWPKEISTPKITADGLLLLKERARLSDLPSPWRLASTDEIVLEFKMQGDHIDREELEWALLRRQAHQRLRAAQHPNDKTKLPLWIVAAYLPEWIKDEYLISVVDRGCYWLEPSFYEVYWIAANELPRKEELIPFLVTRTGRALVELCKWLFDVRPKLGEELVELVPMTENQFEEVVQTLKEPDEAERLRRRRRIVEALAESTGFKEELLSQGQARGEVRTFTHLVERRLSRALSLDEQQALILKIATLGPSRVSEAVLEFSKQELLAWLTDKDAS